MDFARANNAVDIEAALQSHANGDAKSSSHTSVWSERRAEMMPVFRAAMQEE